MTSKTIIESFKLDLKACVREVPGKRRVFQGFWDGKSAYLKVFEHPSSAKKHYERELKGLNLFTKNKVLTPEILWHGRLKEISDFKIKSDSYAIVTKSVENNISFNEYYQNNNDRKKALKELFEIIQNHHKTGLIQNDIHPGNFIVSGEDIYSLDGDTLIESSSKEEQLKNFALLLAQFPVSDNDLLVSTLAEVYSLPDDFELLLFNARVKRCQKYLKKVFRQCTEIEHQAKDGLNVWIKKDFLSVELEEVSRNPETLFPDNPEDLLKNGNTASVALAKIGSLDVVIKRNNFNKNFKAFTRRLRKSRSAISWENAFRLVNYGFLTPTPIALIENKVGPLLKNAYIITEKKNGPDALDYFLENPDEGLADKVIEMFKGFEKCRITHGDCKATNFIISDRKVYIIDLDAMCEHKNSTTFKKYFRKDLMRWMANWSNSPQLTKIFKDKFEKADLLKYL